MKYEGSDNAYYVKWLMRTAALHLKEISFPA